MLGDVTPSQLRLIHTGTVYTGRDNKFTVTVQKYVGRRYVPVDLSEVTQLLLIIPGPEPVVIDSLTYPDAFSVAGSLLTLDLSDFAFAPGTYTAQLVAFDAEHPRGQVLCETYENELTFTVRDVSATGSVPLPTLSYVEEAPANGVTYGRRDGVWVAIEAQAVGVGSFNGRTGTVTLLSSDVTSALGFTPLQSSDLPLLAAVATSGAYADLTGAPAIPSTPGDIGAATAAQGALADTAVQPQTLTDQLATKVDVVAGKQLSTEDYTTAEKTKLGGIAAGATANQTDATLLSRANHTGTQAASTISDLTEAVQDVMGATLVQGANVTITYDDAANTLTIAAAGGSGGTVQPWSAVTSVAASATLALADAGKYLRCTAAATITVPPQASVAWAADTEIHIEQTGAGAVTVAAGAGVTINKPTGYNAKTMSQYAVVTLKRVAADTWTLIGALEVAA